MTRVCFGNSQISDVAQLGRQVVQISKTVYAIAKLVTPMCLSSARNLQKSNCLMIRVGLGNNQISAIDVQFNSIGQISGSNHPNRLCYCKTSYSNVFAIIRKAIP